MTRRTKSSEIEMCVELSVVFILLRIVLKLHASFGCDAAEGCLLLSLFVNLSLRPSLSLLILRKNDTCES